MFNTWIHMLLNLFSLTVRGIIDIALQLRGLQAGNLNLKIANRKLRKIVLLNLLLSLTDII